MLFFSENAGCCQVCDVSARLCGNFMSLEFIMLLILIDSQKRV